jgi:hypothetical protein
MKQLWRYLLILIIVLALWKTVLIWPLKIFTVYLHELGHALMALIFGQGIQEIQINLNQSGHTLVQTKGWFSSFMIANGGYLGSVLFALLILYLKRTVFKKYILGTLALLLLTVSIRFSGFSFTLLYSIIFTGAVLLIYMIHNDKLSDWVIDIMGIASVAYAVYDTFVDTILLQLNLYFHLIPGWGSKQPMTDAVALYRLTHIPAMIWGIIWLGIALFAINVLLIKGKPSRARKYGG